MLKPVFINVSFYVSLLVSFYEFLGIVIALLTKKTKSLGRLFIRLSIFILFLLMFWQYRILDSEMKALKPQDPEISSVRILPPDVQLVNMPFLICVFTSAIIISFLIIEVFNLISARKKRITKNFTRLITAFILFLTLIPIFIGSLNIWDDYTKELAKYSKPLEQKYEDLLKKNEAKKTPPAETGKEAKK